MTSFFQKSGRLFLLLSLLGAGACSRFNEATQFSNKTSARSLVAELYGKTTKTITVSHEEASHIAWIGFVRSNDYKYFKITKVAVGDTIVTQNGVERNGEVFVPNSSAIVEDVSVGVGTNGNNTFVDGSINVAGQGDLKITVEYAPLKAVKTEVDPHVAYLILFYDQPKQGSQRIKLTGLTEGMKNEKCARAVETMTPIVYGFKGGKFDFYFCGAEVPAKGQANIATLDPSDPGYHGISTNLTPIEAKDPLSGTENVLTFYKVDETTVCLLSNDLSNNMTSIPEFIFPIPEGLAPIDEMTIQMAAGSFAECALDPDTKEIDCRDNLQIDTGVVPVSPLTITNKAFSEDELVTSDCTDFGAISGSGSFGVAGEDIQMVLKGKMLPDKNTQDYNIVDSLVAAEMKLECLSGCE